MKLDYEISELAKQDLEDIWLYTFEKWSANQANNYYEQIIEAILLITKNPKIGKSISYIKVQHRMFLIKSHLIIYKIDNQLKKIENRLVLNSTKNIIIFLEAER